MLLAFDFDGVMCDSTRECMVLALAVYSHRKLELNNVTWLEGILQQTYPEDLRSHFFTHRKYIRWPREYYFILMNPGRSLTQKDFDAFIQDLPEAAKTFEKTFFALRAALQQKLYDQWINLFDPEPEVLNDVRTACSRYKTCVLTGRDAQSAASFFKKHNVPIEIEDIYDAQKYSDKEKGLAALTKDYRIKPEEVILLDDNISHLRKLKAHGVTPLWARWGYVCDEHLEFAAEVHSVERSNWLKAVANFTGSSSV